MLFDETYKELEKDSIAIYKEKKSKFIAYAHPIYNESQFKTKISEIKKAESSANHHCYAYILHPDKSVYKFSDDGEPNYTAGKPILKQIQKHALTNILIVVVRYFGGIKLGIPGLIHAYKNATENVLNQSKFITKMIKEKYIISCDDTEMNYVMRLIKKHSIEIINTDFQKQFKISILVPRIKAEIIIKEFKKNHKLNISY